MLSHCFGVSPANAIINLPQEGSTTVDSLLGNVFAAIPRETLWFRFEPGHRQTNFVSCWESAV